MVNHRSPKPGLQVRFLPLLFLGRQQESKRAVFIDATIRSIDAASGRPAAKRKAPIPAAPAILINKLEPHAKQDKEFFKRSSR